MTKLLGTIVLMLVLTSTIAQRNKLDQPKKDSSSRFTDSVRSLPPLEVKSIRVNENSPFAKTTISKNSITQYNYGQDLPFLVQNTPSVVVHSDAGTGIGYTGIRIRGTDGTRINVTLNGIPYNDAESSMTYFVDLPDFGSSVNSIQIQRGVGTSTNGAGAFGATMNLSTNDYRPKAYSSLQNSIGSFRSLKNNLLFGTGLVNDRFTIDGRLSNIKSDGYIDRAKSDLKSFYISSTYWGDHSNLRLNIFSGKEKTYQSWYGVPEELLATHRTYNPAGMEKINRPYENQTDNYTQTHYQLFFNQQLNLNIKWNTAFFLTRGKGYYEEYKAAVDIKEYGLNSDLFVLNTNPDIVRRRWLDNNFYGQIASLQYEKLNHVVIVGGGWSTYDGIHFGELPYFKNLFPNSTTSTYQYYNNNAIKNDLNTYLKWQYQINNKLNSFIDFQYRRVKHTMYGFDKTPELTILRKFNFFNPKWGITFINGQHTYYTSIAIAHKEPNRDDFETSLVQQPQHEILYDWESGYKATSKNVEWGINLYYMYYKNQLVLTGKINNVGAYTRTNTPKSFRAGLEIEGQWNISPKFTTNGNITFSKNKINQFEEYYDDYDAGGQKMIQHRNTDIALSPNTTATHHIHWKPNEKWQFTWANKYVSKQYLDNTQNESRILKAYFVNDLNLSWRFMNKAKWSAQLQLYIINILDKIYEPNGYTYSYLWGGTLTTSNNYYPMAGRNFWISLKIDIK